MLSNFHTHTVFCDGDSECEEIVLSALEKGFDAIGFSGHAYTDFDTSYCIKDLDGYFAEIARLKDKYAKDIEIYAGLEEDAYCPCDRSSVEYIIGSCHYVTKNGKYYPVDCDADTFKECIEVFGGDTLAFADSYYSNFCSYIHSRKPDIIGHFDLITKYEERIGPMLLCDPAYNALAEKYIALAAGSGCIFEINTGAMSRKARTSPYPAPNLLAVLKKLDAPIILSADSHHASTIDCAFEDTKAMLYDTGFRYLWTISRGEFVKYPIK